MIELKNIKTTYNNNLPYRISIDDLESYMIMGIDNFVAREKFNAIDQSKRIQLCDKYFYYSYTCYDPYEMEYSKMPDYVIKRIGALTVINRLIEESKDYQIFTTEYLESVKDEIVKDDLN